MTEKYILTGDVRNGEQYKITDTEKECSYRNNKDGKQKICNLLNNLTEKNEELQARNDRQAERLDNLYNLIEDENWTALKEMIQEFKTAEELLKKEWGCYNE